MNTAYTNHTSGVDINEGTAWYLYENRLAGMHYQDLPFSTNPESFEENHDGSGTLKKFINYVEDGAILGVRNNAHPMLQGGLIVGSAGPTDGVEQPEHSMRIIVTRPSDPDGWECKCEGNCTAGCSLIGSVPVDPRADEAEVLKAAEEHAPEAHEVLQALVRLRDEKVDQVTVLGDTKITLNENGSADEVTILQALKLNPDDSHWVWYRDFPSFATLLHRGTTNGWNRGNEQLIAAYLGVGNLLKVSRKAADELGMEIDATVELLSSGQLETLCSEYLREEVYKQYFHEYPAGGSLTAADVIARDSDSESRVISQVTFDGPKEGKIRALASYASTVEDDVDLWYFGADVSENNVPDDVEIDITMKPIGEVFEEMRGSPVREAILTVPIDPPTPGSR